MTESPETTPSPESRETSANSAAEYRYPRDRDAARRDHLHQILAWVGIVAGVLFIVAVIFFSGLAVGRASGGGWHRGYQGGQPTPGFCPMMGSGGPGGMTGPGGMMGPDDMGPGTMRPGQPSPPA